MRNSSKSCSTPPVPILKMSSEECRKRSIIYMRLRAIQILGAARHYGLTGYLPYRRAVEFFWEQTALARSFAKGAARAANIGASQASCRERSPREPAKAVSLTTCCRSPTGYSGGQRIRCTPISTSRRSGATAGIFSASQGSFLSIRREWQDGDVVELQLPMGVRAEQLPDDSSLTALMVGPLVLAAKTGEELIYCLLYGALSTADEPDP